MRFCRFRHRSSVHYGVVRGDSVIALTGTPWESVHGHSPPIPLTSVELCPPTEASKIVAVGQNYRKHAEELGKSVPPEPLIFMKPPTALNGHRQPILLPPDSAEVHHEAELALVIGRRIRDANEHEAAAAIFALTCFNDVTARDIQRREVQYTRAKSYDTFACAGPWMETSLSPADLRVVCRVNGQVRQDGRTSDMIFPPARLVSFISHIMTLLPGDLVSTGTPSGVGPLKDGDQVEVEIEGIGTLANPVSLLRRA